MKQLRNHLFLPHNTNGTNQANENQILINDWYPLARSEDLPPGGVLSARLMGRELVLWRGSDHRIAVWNDRCPHRGVCLSAGQVVNDRLVCSYHGLAYDLVGNCVQIPAHPGLPLPKQSHIDSYHVQEKYGLVFVSLGHPDREVSHFPEWNDANYRRFLCGPYSVNASGLRVIENFFDIAHFPFVHTEILGEPDHAVVDDYEVSKEPDHLVLRNVRFWQPDPDGTGKGQRVKNTYQIHRPLTAYLSKEMPEQRLTIFCMVTPLEEETCIYWMWIAMNYAHDCSDHELRSFQDRVIAQDLTILELQRPRCLPLNLQSEFHLPCDRASIAYRQWLRELGVTYGAII